MVCRDSTVLCTRVTVSATNTTENKDRAGISSTKSSSHSRVKKNRTPAKASATPTVTAKAKKAAAEINTDSTVQLVVLAPYTDFGPIEVSNNVSRVPLSRSITKA